MPRIPQEPHGFQDLTVEPVLDPIFDPGHPTRHSNIGHPNPTHGERPAMLPSMRVGQAKRPTPFVRTIVRPSGKRK
jgi:hypothetical protein